jgi:transposase
MGFTLGVDIACRAPHQASLAVDDGRVLWSGHRFRTSITDLERLWARLPAAAHGAAIRVVMEPTRNAWVALAGWFRRHGATVVLVPPERSADLRAYYAKHTKSDRLDSVLLARLPLLHPEGLHPEQGLGPGDALRRATKLHSTLILRRSTILARLDALLEILGPTWRNALGSSLGHNTPLRFLAAGYADPDTLRRLGHARLARFLHRHSRGAWNDEHAHALLTAASETSALWDNELDFADLADDIAVEARLALAITTEITELDERITTLVARRDPTGIIASAPGVGPITSAMILGGRDPRLQRPRPIPARLGHLRASRRTHQTRRRAPAPRPVHRRPPRPTSRPHPGREISPTHDPSRQAPHLGALPHRHHAAHPHRGLLAPRHPLPTPRPRRPRDHRRASPNDHRRALHHPRRTPQHPQRPHRDGPAKQRVAARSIDQPVTGQRHDPGAA